MFEPLEQRELLAAVPLATLSLPASPFIGDTVNFSVTFDNTSATDSGYGPFVDLIMPKNGPDGSPTLTQDGLTFTGATYLGQTKRGGQDGQDFKFQKTSCASRSSCPL